MMCKEMRYILVVKSVTWLRYKMENLNAKWTNKFVDLMLVRLFKIP